MSAASAADASLRQLADLPCPRGLPLVGNLHQLPPRQFHLVLERWARELGTPFRFRVGATSMTVWADPEVSQIVLRQRPHLYRRYASLEPAFDEIGCKGLFFVEGKRWEAQRKFAVQALSMPHIKTLYPMVAAITERLRLRWQHAAAQRCAIEMLDDLKRYTVDITSTLAFGENAKTIDGGRDIIQEHLGLIFPTLTARTYLPLPYWRYLKLPRDRRLDRAMREVHRYVRAMIGRARQRMRDEPAEAARNFLEAMLHLRDTPGSDITDDEVVANIITLLLAGEDTTANSIAWALFYLAADPPLQQRLAGRARQVLGTAPVCPNYGLLKELDLFEAVCTEASRLRPIIWGQIFQPVADVCLANTFLPAGTGMILLNRPAMLDARNFSEPRRFDPERWLQQRCPHDQVHESRAYLQFGAGPRVCPGRHLASIQMKLVLSMLTANFSMRLAVDPATIQEHCAFTVTPSAMPMHLMPRA